MTKETMRNALDGAEVVLTDTDHHRDYFGLWWGGVHYAVYTNATAYEWTILREFELSNDEGEPVDEQTARESLRETLEEVQARD